VCQIYLFCILEILTNLEILADRGYPILDSWYEKYNYHVLSENVNPQKTEQLHENLGLEIGKNKLKHKSYALP
jgi:hypothetical protein